MNALPVMDVALRDLIEQATARIDQLRPKWVDIPTLLPADALLDLYGEDMRDRAYIVHDPVDGDMVLRPDFTLPVLQMHFRSGAGSGRYAYSGRVWRKRRETNRNDRSFWQLGFEQYALSPSADDDAQVFALANSLAEPYGLTPVMGDLGLIFAALDRIEMAEYRRRALKRHVWRPRAFARLLNQYQRPVDAKSIRRSTTTAPVIGLRDQAMIDARLERLNEEASAMPLPADAVAFLDALLKIKGTLANAVDQMQSLTKRYSMGAEMAHMLDARASALAASGLDPSKLAFDAGFGRTSMEYYDGMVFGWFREGVSAPVLSGGRYDGLTAVAASGKLAAIGVAFRPELVLL